MGTIQVTEHPTELAFYTMKAALWSLTLEDPESEGVWRFDRALNGGSLVAYATPRLLAHREGRRLSGLDEARRVGRIFRRAVLEWTNAR